MTNQKRTEGEVAFEAYLNSVGIEPAYEEPVEGTSKLPDYRVTLDGEPSRFEVKQFDFTAQDARLGFGSFDSYAPLREKIEAARKKFKGLRGTAACSLVLYNNHRPLIFLDPSEVYGAMLGDLGATFPFDTETGMADFSQARQAFLGRGKMIRYGKGGARAAPQNTTISAIVVVRSLPIGQRRFNAKLRREGSSSPEETLRMYRKQTNIGLEAPQVRVFENPFAARPLGRSFGVGPWDERFGPSGNSLDRLFAGAKLLGLENEETAAGIDVDPWKR